MKSRVLGVTVVGAGMFVLGRLSAPQPSHEQPPIATDLVATETTHADPNLANATDPPAGGRIGEDRSGTRAAGPSPSGSSQVAAKNPVLTSALAQATKRELLAAFREREDRVTAFLQNDRRFGGMQKMSSADWERARALGKFNGIIRFNFEPSVEAHLEVNLTENKAVAQFSTPYKADGKEGSDLQTMSTQLDITNGRVIGLDAGGRSFTVSISNPVDVEPWLDYSNFAFQLPVGGKTPGEAREVLGLNDELEWVAVGVVDWKVR